MDQKQFIKRILIVTSVFTFIGFGNVLRLKDIDTIRAVDIVSLLTLGIGIGAFAVSLVMLVKSKK